MLTKLPKLSLVVKPSQLSRVQQLIRCPIRVFLDLSFTDTDKLAKLAEQIERLLSLYADLIAGFHIRLSRLLQGEANSLLKRLSEEELKLLIDCDVPVSGVIKNFFVDLVRLYDVIPVVNVKREVSTYSVLESADLDTVVIDYPTRLTDRVLVNLSYLKDYLNTLLRLRRIVIGSIVKKVDLDMARVIRDFVQTSSLFVVKTLDLAAQLCEILARSPTRLHKAVLDLIVSGHTAVDVPIE